MRAAPPWPTRCQALIAKIGENMSVRRAAALAVNPGVVATYVHNAASPELGKIGVLVGLQSEADTAALQALGKQIAMHVAAAAPIALSADHVPAEVAERERAIFAEQAREMRQAREHHREDGRRADEEVLPGIGAARADLRHRRRDPGRQGRREGRPRISASRSQIVGFLRFAVGEGIEKEDADFADEVKSMAGH